MNRTLHPAAVAVLLLLSGSFCYASTGKVTGRVIDTRTSEPVIGANVVIVGTRMGAATDTQGEYFIANVPPGYYELKVSGVGYRDVLVRDVRVRVDATTEVNIRLDEKAVDIGEEIVVTAQRPLVDKDNTSSRVFVESQDITKRPAAQIEDVVAALPSINFEGGVLRVRGGGLNEVAFIVDGARARNPMDQDPYTNINLSSIQEMEVITGSFNAEYGEARSGVFNIITKEGGDRYEFYTDVRYTPPGVKHWGPSLYDQGSALYWENSHARHLQWWIEYPDMWVDPNGNFGNDPRSIWTPEQAYQNYLTTHSPLTSYEKIPGYSIEASIGGPIPALESFRIHLSGKYRSEPPLMGNSYRSVGRWFDGTAKISYQLDNNTKLLFSGFLGLERSSWGVGGGPDYFWAGIYGIDSRYAYYDFEGFPTVQTDGQTLKMTRIVDESTMFEVRLSRVFAKRTRDVFPDDPLGWVASDATRDNLRAFQIFRDSTGKVTRVPVEGGNQNRIGFNTTGYYFRYDDRNTDLTLNGFYQNQINKNWQLKTGAEFTYYSLDHFNEAKSPPRVDDRVYHPYQGSVYVQNKLEFSGFIMNAGFRFDFYNPNDVVYTDPFNPLISPTSPSELFSQLSPRLGISHPIDENTVLHFSYGHFFQRGPFGDYGEGNSDAQSLGSLTTFIVSGTTTPWVLGNRNTKPEKTVAYELGIERNFFEEFVLGVTAYYKDIRNTLRVVTIEGPDGVYRTNGNGDYADVRGLEIWLRKQTSPRVWGTTWGYLNFTTQIGINGRNGDPVAISPTRVLYGPSGDYIVHSNPRLKAGLYYQTPMSWDLLGGIFGGISVSIDYQAVFPNDQLFGDFFEVGGKKYVRPTDQNTNLKVRKDLRFADNIRLGLYMEIRNLFNDRWLNFSAFEAASPADQERFATSDFDFIPSTTSNGVPILDLAKYRNLPRSVVFGATLEL